jgi:phosphopantothenoylcysteine decarboxylase / phosphopantothenate---cysteine ligase
MDGLLLKNKKILLGVSGSIAAYKAAILVRLLVKEGAEVKVVMTAAAKEFITPLTLSTLSKNPTYSTFLKDETGLWHNHVELGLWADAFVIAPATAHTLAKCANGICDDLLIAVYLSAKCPVIFAPAMDLDMYAHGSTKANIEKLESYGNVILKTGFGELASGLVGDGRMIEPEYIIEAIKPLFGAIPSLKNKKVLITAGPTQEPLDPVRFISNHSSGKMGLAIAQRFAQAGSNVTLVCGKINIIENTENIKKIPVISANDMYLATQKHFETADIVVFAAAVADYTPAMVADKKIKKKEDKFSIELIKTVDLAATFGKQKNENQVLVGFALETDNELENAKDKLKRKNFDLIVLNSLKNKGAGFGHDTNQITIINALGEVNEYPLKSKTEVANDIVNAIAKIC